MVSRPSKDAGPFVPSSVKTMPTVWNCIAGGLNVTEAVGLAVVTVSEYAGEVGGKQEVVPG